MEENLKQLLIKDLCARLPYGVKVQVADYKTPVELSHINTKNGNGRKPYCFVFAFEPEKVKPYLRPMSSMTEEEWEDYQKIRMIDWVSGDINGTFINAGLIVDWLNAHHFDYRGLIEKGLALEATSETYNKE